MLECCGCRCWSTDTFSVECKWPCGRFSFNDITKLLMSVEGHCLLVKSQIFNSWMMGKGWYNVNKKKKKRISPMRSISSMFQSELFVNVFILCRILEDDLWHRVHPTSMSGLRTEIQFFLNIMYDGHWFSVTVGQVIWSATRFQN